MARSSGALMRVVQSVLGGLLILNFVAFLLFVLILAASFAAEEVITNLLLERSSPDPVPDQLLALRLVMTLGIIAIPLAHILLTRLRMIVRTVQDGDPFVPENARRLTIIAWTVLGLQFCDLAFGAVSLLLSPEPGTGWALSLTGWISVLLLFVLARVFDHGTRMREEIEGTV